MLTEQDKALERIVREWASTSQMENVDVHIHSATAGRPTAFELQPRNRAAARLTCWVADDGRHVAFAVDKLACWSDAVLLTPEAVTELLNAVADGRVSAHVRRIGGRIVARKAEIQLPGGRALRYGEIGLFTALRWPKWETIRYQPFGDT